MNPTAKDYIKKYYRSLKEWPETSDIVQNCHCSPQDAEEWLKRCQGSVKAAGVKEPVKWSFDKAVIRFTHQLQYFAFLFASIADMALAVFFYWSLGFDLASRVVLGIWGIVQTGGKLFAWANKKTIIALWAAFLSVVATVSIFLAVIDTQSASAAVSKTDTVLMIESQIADKSSENKTLDKRLAETPSDYLKAQRDISAMIAENDKTISALRTELVTAQKVVKRDFELDAWKIFSQLTSFKWNDPSHIFALVIILTLAVFFEMLIYVTIPKEELRRRKRA